MYSVKFSFLALLFLCISVNDIWAQPCYANPQGFGSGCTGQTSTFYSSASACTTCTYAWTQTGGGVTLVSGGGQNDVSATYTFSHPVSSNTTAFVQCTYNDPTNTFCQGGVTTDIWDVNLVSERQLS